MENNEVDEVEEVSASVSEVEEVSAPGTEGDQAAETITIENDEIQDNISEIKEILLQNQETSETVQEIPSDYVTDEDFINFNNSFCYSVTAIILICGIIGGLILGKAFQGIFK